MVNLTILQMVGGNFEGDFTGVFQKLRWLGWFDCPMEFQATNLSFDNLVVLRLSGIHITEAWDGWHTIMVLIYLAQFLFAYKYVFIILSFISHDM